MPKEEIIKGKTSHKTVIRGYERYYGDEKEFGEKWRSESSVCLQQVFNVTSDTYFVLSGAVTLAPVSSSWGKTHY